MTGNKGIFRNINILREFNASSTTEIIDIYQPGWLNPYDIISGAKYSGFITSLRLTIDLTSIPELTTVQTDVLADDATINDAATETFNGNSKKCLTFYLRTNDTPLIKVADIYLFNQRPYYYLDLINYFTSAGTFDVAPDTTLSCGLRDAGSGLLTGNDRILLLGTCVEEAPEAPETNNYLEVLAGFISTFKLSVINPVPTPTPTPTPPNPTPTPTPTPPSTNTGDINDMPLQIKSTDYNIQKNERILVITGVSIYLPSSPTNGDELEIYAATENIVTISSSPNTITRILEGETSYGEQRANIGSSLGFGGKLIFNDGTWMCNKSNFGYQYYN